MNKNQALLAAACLALALVGCQTDEGVQKGYLTPQQTSSDSASQTASSSSSSESTESTSERLPPPSVTQDVEQSASTESSTPPADSNASTPAPTESAPASSNETASASSSSTEPDRSPDAVSKYSQQPGGKVGVNKPGARRSSSRDDDDEREAPEPTKAARQEAPSQKDDDDDEAPAVAARTSAVSSSLSSGSTRIAEPTGNVRGVVVTVNTKAKFVVVKYNYRAIPSIGKVLSVLRNGVKVGQIKVTKPVKPPHSTADIIDGDIQRGDIVE